MTAPVQAAAQGLASAQPPEAAEASGQLPAVPAKRPRGRPRKADKERAEKEKAAKLAEASAKAAGQAEQPGPSTGAALTMEGMDVLDGRSWQVPPGGMRLVPAQWTVLRILLVDFMPSSDVGAPRLSCDNLLSEAASGTYRRSRSWPSAFACEEIPTSCNPVGHPNPIIHPSVNARTCCHGQ